MVLARSRTSLVWVLIPAFTASVIATSAGTNADTIVQYAYCVSGGTKCPERSDENYCPLPYSDSNYYCGPGPDPYHCLGPGPGSCIDMTPASGATAVPQYPCGFEMSCKTQTIIKDSNGISIYCTQVPSECQGGS